MAETPNPQPERPAADVKALEREIVEALKTVYDPEIPVDIWELGLIYSLEVSPDGQVLIKMTLTAPACPAAEVLPWQVEAAARSVPGVTDARVELVFDPPWNKDMMSEEAKYRLGFI